MRDPRRVGLLSVALLLLVLAADVFTSSRLVFSILLSVPIALSALAASRRLTQWLVGAAITADALAGVLNALPGGVPARDDAVNRGFSALACLLVGLLVLRLRVESAQAAAARLEAERSARERALRRLVTRVSTQGTLEELAASTARELRAFLGARRVAIGALVAGTLREPWATDPPGRDWNAAPGTPLPPAWLVAPAGVASGRVSNPEPGLLVTRWTRDGPDLLALAFTDGGRDAEQAGLLGEARAALEPAVQQATLLESLRAQRQELERRHAVIRDLVYAFSHDLRTPLLANALVMRLAVQGAYGPLPEELRRSLDNGLNANQDLLDLAGKLLVVARLEGGEGPADVERLDLAEVVRQRARELEPRLAERNLKLDLRLDPAPVRGSAADLRRVAQNLLDNALKFSPPGGTIVARVAQANGQAVFGVTDAGPGVPEDLRPRLFQRFRGGGAGAGSGLGLYLARSIVQAHGGHIAYRREGGQSIFEASLPLDATPDEGPPARALEGAAG